MRRVVVFCLALSAVAVPAAAFAAHDLPADGVLVVRNGHAPRGVPVVQLTLTGSVIGQVTDQGRIVIDTGANGPTPEVTGADLGPVTSKNPDTPTAQWWQSTSGNGFTFRVVGKAQKFTILIYGSGVNLTAVGTGFVWLAGMPDTPQGDRDGKFSINGNDFKSLPGAPTRQLVVGDNNT